MILLFRRLLSDEEGSTAIEYALLASLMAIVTIGALRALSSNISDNYSQIAEAVDAAM